MKLFFETIVPMNYVDVFNGFNVDLFKALKPPLLNLEVKRFDGCKTGDQVHLGVGALGLSIPWVSVITDHGENETEFFFIDEGSKLPPPLSKWRHRHSIRKISKNESVIIDDIQFSCHGGIAVELLLKPVLWAQFNSRGPIYLKRFSGEK
tara:strand:+ start:24806 stop:25255 length:450 start_codon:yes stop_codon:yes gene_type:complete